MTTLTNRRRTVRMRDRGGILKWMTDHEALLLQAAGCNSEGRPCGKCLRVTVKTEHMHLRLRPWGGKRSERNEEWRGEERRGGGGVHWSKLFVIFCIDLLRLSVSYSSSIYNLFPVCSAWPGLTPTLLQHTSPFIYSFGPDLLLCVSYSEFMLFHLSHLQLLKQFLVWKK